MAVSQRRNAVVKPKATAADVASLVQASIVQAMTVRTFTTGSVGAYANGKVTVAGDHYQCSAQAVVIGSKAQAAAHADKEKDPVTKKLVAAPVVTADGQAIRDAVALVTPAMSARSFASGNTGFEYVGKVVAGDQAFQVNVRAVKYTPKAK